MFDSQSARKIVIAVGLALVFGALIFEFVVPAEHVGQLAQSGPAPAVPPQAAPTNGNPPVPAQTATSQTQATDQTVIPPSSPVTAGVASAQPSAASSPAAAGNEPVASDSQITADVKSHIAIAAVDGNVDVTTTNGVVALAGSAPSEDAVDRARLAAFRVAGVKNVDVSALKVGGPLR